MVKMKLAVVFVLFIHSLVEASNLCQVFNEHTKSFEKYCDDFKGTIPKNCSGSAEVEANQLKLGGCDRDQILKDVTKFASHLSVIDISQSGHIALGWLNLKLKNLQKFNASHNEISFVSNLLDKADEISEIDLSYNKLQKIERASFGKLCKLVKINLSHNDLRSISSGTFVNSKNLQSIDLSGNQLTDIPYFFGSKHLKTVHLEGNPITEFNCLLNETISVFISWESITKFDGSHCNGRKFHVIYNAPNEGVVATGRGTNEIHCQAQCFKNMQNFTAGVDSFANLKEMISLFGPSIEHLDLSGNVIEKLNSNTFETFDRLRYLSLSRTKLTDFDFGVLENQTHLLTLDLSFNHLKRMNNPEFLSNLSALSVFNIAKNQLNNTLDLIEHLGSSVETLNLFDNFVGQLNATAFERLTALKTLNLSYTQLLITDSNPFAATKLTSLDVSHNNLRDTYFDLLASTLSQLEELYAINCQILDSSKVFEQLGSPLKKLDLSLNYVGFLNEHTFEKLNNLECLNLSKTKIFNIKLSTFKHQTKLRSLDLSDNQLMEIDFDSYSKDLKQLNLQWNDLITVNNLTQSHLPALESLAISKNQLSCEYVLQLKNEWKQLTFIGDAWKQKHGKNCDPGNRTLVMVITAIVVCIFLAVGITLIIYRQCFAET